MTSEAPRALMLLANGWEADSRVIREANALARAGFDAHVLALGTAQADSLRNLDGVTYHTLHAIGTVERAGEIPRVLLLHLCVLAQGCRNLIDEGKWTEASSTFAAALARLFLLCFLAPIMVFANIPRAVISRNSAMATWLRAVFGVCLEWTQLDVYIHFNQYAAHALSYAKSLNPSIVHAHDLVTLSAGRALASSLGVPLIYDAHELETGTNYPGITVRMHQWIVFYEKHLARECAAVITVCESIADWLQTNYRISRPTVVYNSPDLVVPERSDHGDTVRLRLGLAAGTPLALYIGSITIDRGLEICVRALAHYSSLHFACVGPLYEEIGTELLRLSKEIGVQDRFHLLGSVPSSDVTRFIADADCSVIAIQNVCLSYYYCFPNKLLESVFAGLPVVAARLLELERFMTKYPVGLIVDETDPSVVSSAIREIVENRAKFEPSLETLESVAAIYGWEAQRRKLLELYKTLSPPANHRRAAITGGV